MNNNTTSTCQMRPTTWIIWEQAYYISYYWATPIYFFIGFFGNIILLIAFKKQSKTESAYAYQVLVIIGKTLEMLAFTSFVMSFKCWAKGEGPGVEWFRKNYFLNFYSAHLANPLQSCFTCLCSMFSFAMAIDRVVALSNPFKYRLINHRFYLILTITISMIVSMATTSLDGFIFIVTNDGPDMYKLGIDWDFYTSSIYSSMAQILIHLRTAVRIVCLVGLISLNIFMVIIFQRRSKKVSQMTNNNQKVQARKEIDKALFQLTVWQSIFTCFGQIPSIIYYILAFIIPNFMGIGCWGMFLSPFTDATVSIADAVDFFVVMVINRKVRRMIFGVLSCGKWYGWGRSNNNSTATPAKVSEESKDLLPSNAKRESDAKII